MIDRIRFSRARLRGFFFLALLLLALAVPARAQFLPLEFDWRDHNGVNLVSSVKNQQSCNSCWIFSGVAMAESRCMIEMYRRGFGVHEVDFSEQYVMDCGSGYFGAFSCGDGGYTKDVLTHLRDYGAPYEDCYEYVSADGTCPAATCPDSGEPLVLYTPVETIGEHYPYWDTEELMTEIMENGPVAADMEVYSDFASYSSGIYQHVTGQLMGGKAVLIVGWGRDPTGTPYWICKNTWGTGWGEDGFFRILRDLDHANCNFGEWIWYASVTPDVSAVPGAVAAATILAQNVPNPFNPSTEIAYTLPTDGRATLAVFDLAGRRVCVLADADHLGGREYRVSWDGRGMGGAVLPSGVYFYRLDQGDHRQTRRMVMLR